VPVAADNSHRHGLGLRRALAGHPPPLLIGPDGTVQLLDHTQGLALVHKQLAPRSAARLLPAGSALLLYTDGLIERRGVNLAASLAELCRQAAAAATQPLDEICDRLLRHAPGTDDVALLAVRVSDPTG
jgi:serine phosphatase RsbU (regulator of sigma subunit)